jgi:hypothetical protein
MGRILAEDDVALMLAKITEAYKRGLPPAETLDIIKTFLRERKSAAFVIPIRSRAGK